MVSRALTADTFHGQVQLSDFAALRDLGFRLVVNNRPDGEDPNQPSSEAQGAAARAAGLDYLHLPVTGGTISTADGKRFSDILAEAAGPVMAYCRSGARSLHLWMRSHPNALQGANTDRLLAIAAEIDLKPAMVQDWAAEIRARQAPWVEVFFEPRTFSLQYVVVDWGTRSCAMIDPVLDYDEKSGSLKTTSADALLDYVERNELSLTWILDTHPHADHFSASHYLKTRTGAKTGIGAHIVDVQALWKRIYNLPELATDGSQWDHLFEEGETFAIGSLQGRVLFSPGHTLASVTYLIEDAAFIHDTLFMPDSGTARADFPGGDASALWNSIQRILSLPSETRLFTGHDYQPGGRPPRWLSTVEEQRRTNPHVVDQTKQSFIALREARDRTLPMPKLILHALQINIRGGRLPQPEDNGTRYLKIPLDTFKDVTW
ncbi:Beta-lactamase hydrolase-like protein [Hyphomicrobiales bacterium]|nr:Beta-lactamase hydrolase-like protein [Hyphomicrobiales bacterium]CAH1697453.1 Beta-lactamase hydrolase-like protein [Hyphomicrobiales bacterium]CAI0345641.1 Beta-lactamase hydrolase-like protein [Hyphomicrobiales bacterium]